MEPRAQLHDPAAVPCRFPPCSGPENVSTSQAEAEDLADFTGLAPKDLVILKPERLVLHELIIRVNG